MDTIPHAGPFPVPDSRPRCLRWPLMRILIAIVFVMLPFVLLQIILHKLPIAKSLRQVWPALLSSGCCYAMYGMYVRLIERRPMLEFARAGAWREAACGALIGMLLFCLAIAALYVSGAYRITGSNGWSVMVAPFFGMIVAGFLEEILFRGIVFRILQNWLGSWTALLISVLVFALAHASNDSVTPIALASVAA
ncbi:MAG TPA: type II CAAX endopeptidase family protein, partial [Janthinobacterium sp.]|nr:type II CAAX endopeptidase family protein [Janthinobacterium sp.]